MTASIGVRQKKRGRPKTGKTPIVGVRLSQELTDWIDRFRVVYRLKTRSEAIRMLIQECRDGEPNPKGW